MSDDYDFAYQFVDLANSLVPQFLSMNRTNYTVTFFIFSQKDTQVNKIYTMNIHYWL